MTEDGTLQQVIGQRSAGATCSVDPATRNLLSQAPVPTALLIGPDYVFDVANALYEEMVGRPVAGKSYFDAFPELRGTGIEDILRNVYSGIPFSAPEHRVLLGRANGRSEERFFKFNLEPLRDAAGAVYGMMGVAVEITEQVRAREVIHRDAQTVARLNEELREAELAVRRLVDNLPDLAWSARADGYIEFYNQRWYQYTGTTPSQMEGWGWQAVHDPEYVDDVTEKWRNSLASGEPFEMEFPIRGAEGKFRWFLTRVNPLRDANERIIGWVGVNTEVHARKVMLRQLEAASIAKDEFLATVSHELRTPLTAILGWSELLTDVTEKSRLAKGLAVIQRNARVQAKLIEDILDVSRIISGKVRISPGRVKVASVVAAAVETVQPSATARGVRLVVDVEEGAGEIIADEDRIQQIVWNLLSNAVKFTARHGQVFVNAARVRSHVAIRVADTGKGISAAFLPHVFDRFRQDDSSTTKQHAGLGLGLAIVRHLVELHGGTVSAQSAGEGKGATFEILLPFQAVSDSEHEASTERPSAPAEPNAGSTARLENLHILVVDDEDDARDLVATVLEDAGAVVHQAGSVMEAMRVIASYAISVVVSDVGMPNEDGYSFLQRLRSADSLGNRSVPALALTGFARAEDRDRALAAGFQEHVAKPISPSRLLEVVTALASGSVTSNH